MTTATPSLKITAIYAHQKGKRQAIPLFLAKVSAGFPSPADDFLEKKIDLNEHFVRHPAATFFVRVQGESMKNAGIHSGDILIVDRSLEVRDASVVVAVIDGEFTVKHVKKDGKQLFLVPANEDFSAVEITEAMDFTVWGVVTNVIHSFPS
jgi:DNA polymerase V